MPGLSRMSRAHAFCLRTWHQLPMPSASNSCASARGAAALVRRDDPASRRCALRPHERGYAQTATARRRHEMLRRRHWLRWERRQPQKCESLREYCSCSRENGRPKRMQTKGVMAELQPAATHVSVDQDARGNGAAGDKAGGGRIKRHGSRQRPGNMFSTKQRGC